MRLVNTEHLWSSWHFWQLWIWAIIAICCFFSDSTLNLLFLQSQHLDRGGLLRPQQSSFPDILFQVQIRKHLKRHAWITKSISWCVCGIHIFLSKLRMYRSWQCYNFRSRYQQKVESRWRRGRSPRRWRTWDWGAFYLLPLWLLPLPGPGDVNPPHPFARGNWPLKAPRNRYFAAAVAFLPGLLVFLDKSACLIVIWWLCAVFLTIAFCLLSSICPKIPFSFLLSAVLTLVISNIQPWSDASSILVQFNLL